MDHSQSVLLPEVFVSQLGLPCAFLGRTYISRCTVTMVGCSSSVLEMCCFLFFSPRRTPAFVSVDALACRVLRRLRARGALWCLLAAPTRTNARGSQSEQADGPAESDDEAAVTQVWVLIAFAFHTVK